MSCIVSDLNTEMKQIGLVPKNSKTCTSPYCVLHTSTCIYIHAHVCTYSIYHYLSKLYKPVNVAVPNKSSMRGAFPNL